MSQATLSRPHALTQLVLTRFREFLREPESVFWVFVFPILLATGLGLAFRNGPAEVVRVALVVDAPGSSSDLARQALADQPGVCVEAASQAAAEEGLRVGKFALAVVPGAAGSDLVYRYDDARPEGRTARLLADQALQRAAGRQDALPTRDALVQEVGSRYIDFLLPGLIGTNLLSSGIWGIGYSVVEARRKRLLKRLSVTPMSRADYLLSYLVMRLLMTALEVGALLLFGMLVFAVPMRGNCGLFVGVVLLAALTFGALGLLIASRLRSIDGASGLMYFVMLPMWLGSGVFFPFSNFPDVLQPAIRLLPLTAAVSALRGVMLEGMGLGTIMPQLSVLAIWSVTTFALALKVFRWR